MSLSERHDARRMAAAVVAAILVHAGLFVAIPYLTSLDTAPLPDYGPVVVRVELPEAVLEPEPATPLPEPRAEPQPAPAKPAAKPAVRTPAPAAKATPPASTAAAPTRAAGTSAFSQSGAAVGVSAGTAETSIAPGPPPVTLPAVGTTTSGSGEQRSGEAVPLTSRPAGGTIDTRKLAQSLASASAGGTTGAAGTGGTATGGKPGAGASIEWEDAAAAKGREYVVAPKVVLPASALDFLYEVRIAFAVNAEGLVTSARVLQGSGRTDVDNACLVAMRQARFTAAPGAAEIRGTQVFTPALNR